jgi:phosphoribosyl 1,2-cyclic phosphate phosphodiesterase
MSLRLTILGCGSSGGVPRIGGTNGINWGKCNPQNPKNRRRRCSILVESATDGVFETGAAVTRVLVDTSPDIREQLLAASVPDLDAVLYTHDHADHMHGIDDLRPIVLSRRAQLDVYADTATTRSLRSRFGYCFTMPDGSIYPPILNLHEFADDAALSFEGAGGTINATPILLDHGPTHALGFRFGDIAYTPDVSDIPEHSISALEDLDVWIIDALRDQPHVSHFSVETALEWIDRMKPRRAILTNLHVDLDYAELAARLPANAEPAFDGLTVLTG